MSYPLQAAVGGNEILPELLARLNKQFNFSPLVYFSLSPLLQTAFA